MPPINSNLYSSIRRSCRLLGKNSLKEKSNSIFDPPTKTKKKRPLKEDEEGHSNDNNNNNNMVNHNEKRIKSEPDTITTEDVKLELMPKLLSPNQTFTTSSTTCDSKYIKSNSCNIKLPKPDGFLDIDLEELDLERTLLGGQSFRWTKEEIGDNQLVFTGIILNHVLKLWRISDSQIAYKKLNKDFDNIPTNSDNIKEFLIDYFHLKYNLKELYQEWSRKDEHVAKCCESYKGFRILRQDPVENVFSFICATNNNIKRISQMVEKLCKRYGDILETRDDEPKKSVYDSYHSFPPIERLAEEDVFQCLRYELGFGYRAQYINETAKELIRLNEGQRTIEDNNNFVLSPRDYLLSLRKLPYKETCKQLMKFKGIGRKVADCICLMSMDHLSSVPIDCHIYKVVCRNYMPNLRQDMKTVPDSIHDKIGSYFKELHGDLAGWSTSVLFIAELKHLKQDNDQEGEKRAKKELKDKQEHVKKKKQKD